MTVGDVTMWEGDAASATVSVPVDLSIPPTTGAVVVKYVVTSSGASAGSDFIGKKGTLKFPIGIATKPIPIKITGDTIQESDEQVLVHVTSVTGADVEKADGGVTILDDDSDVSSAAVEVGIGSVTVVEADAGSHIANLPITLSVPAPTKIKIAYDVACGTADPDTDYEIHASGTLTIAAKQRVKNLVFKISADNDAETFVKQIIENIRVVGGPGVTRVSQGAATIVDNDETTPDPPPTTPPAPPIPTPPDPAMGLERVSVGNDGSEAQPTPKGICASAGPSAPDGIWGSALSDDGRYVAFASAAGGLVSDDTNGIMDVFVRDLQAGTTERVSVQDDGSQFTSSNPWAGGSQYPAISGDGRYVAFYNGGENRAYIRDRIAGTTQTVSGPGIETEARLSISRDGRYVGYASWIPQTATLIPTGSEAVYVWDRVTGVTKLVAIRSPQQVNSFQYSWGGPALSGDGRYVAFNDGAPGVVPGDTNNCADTFVRDMQTGATERVSVTNAGAQQLTDWEVKCSYGSPSISDDGRYVGFSSAAWNLYPGATSSGDLGSGGPATHPYLHDRMLGTTELVDPLSDPTDESWFTAITGSGRYLIFSCMCGDPVPAVPTVNDFVSIRLDRQTGDMRAVGTNPAGTPPLDEDNGWFTFTTASGISGDGGTILFTSRATNLVPDDTNEMIDAFVQHLP